MIDEIKKFLNSYQFKNSFKEFDDQNFVKYCIEEILKKHKDIDKYKNAWEEFVGLVKGGYVGETVFVPKQDTMVTLSPKTNILTHINYLEQKYNIRKEDLDER